MTDHTSHNNNNVFFCVLFLQIGAHNPLQSKEPEHSQNNLPHKHEMYLRMVLPGHFSCAKCTSMERYEKLYGEMCTQKMAPGIEREKRTENTICICTFRAAPDGAAQNHYRQLTHMCISNLKFLYVKALIINVLGCLIRNLCQYVHCWT